MGFAKDVQRLVSEQHDANLEFAGSGYRLALNPIESRFTEVGFILWAEGVDGLTAVAAGRVMGDDLILDDTTTFDGDTDDLKRLLADLLKAEPVPVAGRGGNDEAVPTAG